MKIEFNLLVKSKAVRTWNSTKTALNLHLLLLQVLLLCFQTEAKCRNGCDLALASYYVWPETNLSYITKIFDQKVEEILKYNPGVVPDELLSGTRVNIPFACECLNGDFLGHTFAYATRSGDTYYKIARIAFSNLTTGNWIRVVNTYDPTQLPDSAIINVTVNCSCGNGAISRDYGLFLTYPLRDSEDMAFVAATAAAGVAPDLLRRFNPGANFNAGSGIVFLPAKG